MGAGDPLIAAWAVIPGLLVGSFLNVCIWRLPLRQSVIRPGSYCPACERRLKWWELVPVLSYLALGGKCRACRTPISPAYPLVELATAAVFAGSVLAWGLSVQAAATMVLGGLLITAGLVDAGHRIIPDALTLPGMAVGLVLSAVNPEVGLVSSAIGLVVGGGLLLGIAMATGGGMGGGDIKLGGLLGAFLGWQGLLVALLVGFVTGAVFGGILMVAGKKGRRDLMAFGPFLALGGLVAAFWGRALLGWYIMVIWG